MKTYLVTGGAGFIGSNFIKYLLSEYVDIHIINLDKLTYAGNPENLKEIQNEPRYTFIWGDICNGSIIEGLFLNYDINYVVNFAAESHVDRSITGPEVFVLTNILGTSVLLNTAKKAWEAEGGFKYDRKFIQVSTDEVYGSLGDEGYFTEYTSLDPHSPYSASKAGADLLVKAYFDTYRMPVNITRCSNNYGPYQFPEKLIPLVINNCLNKNALPVYGNGLNIRDWLHVRDHCRAIDMVINEGKAGEIYNIGGHNERTNIYIVKTIISYIHNNYDPDIDEGLIRYIEDRKCHDRRYGIDPSKIKSELGWEPEIEFENGIIDTIEWYVKNKQWLINVTSEEYVRYYEKMYSMDRGEEK